MSFSFVYTKKWKRKDLLCMTFKKDSYDIGHRLYGELKKLSTCTEQYILAHPEYLTKAYEKMRQVWL